MSSSELHDIDPDGDTLLVLRHSNTPFAVCGTDEQWPNALPQHQSRKSKKLEASILPKESTEGADSGVSGTPSLLEDMPELKHTRYKLSSQTLRRTCSYFARLMSSQWQEAQSEPGFQWTITATDWDSEAVLTLMNILHHRTRVVPRTISLEFLAKIAVLVDYYGCHEAVELWVEIWMAKLDSDIPQYYSRDLLLRLMIAMVFSDKEAFNLIIKVAIRESRGPIHSLGLPIPQQIIDTIEEKRKELIAQLIKSIRTIWAELNDNPGSYSFPECQWMRLGYLDQNLYTRGLKPLPEFPFPGFSVSSLGQGLNKFHSGVVCPCPGEDHVRVLRAAVLSCVEAAFKNSEDGLDLQ